MLLYISLYCENLLLIYLVICVWFVCCKNMKDMVSLECVVRC